MSEPRSSKPVPGSERTAIPDAQMLGPVPADAPVEVTVRLRAGSDAKAAKVYGRSESRAAVTRPLTREQLIAAVGARAEDVRAVEDFAHEHGLTVVQVDEAGRAVHLRGPASAMEQAFGVRLELAELEGRRFRHREGAVHVPPELEGIVTGVYGLDDRTQARPHFRRAPAASAVSHAAARPAAAAAAPPPRSFTPPELARIYQFPQGVDGSGQCVGIVELGGGYRTADLNAYAKSLKLPNPRVVAVAVDGVGNAPGDDADSEVVLDIEVAAGVAPAATIAVYFAPNTDRGFIDAVAAAVHDTHRRPSVISISWGRREDLWTAQGRAAFNQVLQEAAAIGVPVFVAAGDDGATDSRTDPHLHVDFPASSPFAVACGGTRLLANANGTRAGEVVWNELSRGDGATGGGFSAAFNTPSWQKAAVQKAGGHTRGVPDVSANADPLTGYRVHIDGADAVIGGTSAVAPLLAGLTVLCNQAAKHGPGTLPARLYTAGSTASYFDVTQGSNGLGMLKFDARPGWDACTGLGVPVGTAVLASVWGSSPAAPKVKVLKMKGAPAGVEGAGTKAGAR
jgi:kumamolisin